MYKADHACIFIVKVFVVKRDTEAAGHKQAQTETDVFAEGIYIKENIRGERQIHEVTVLRNQVSSRNEISQSKINIESEPTKQ